MKKYFILIGFMCLFLLLNGCDTKCNHTGDVIKIGDRVFIEMTGSTSKYGVYKILIDKDTKVQYMAPGGINGSMETIVDQNGKPILYEGEINE